MAYPTDVLVTGELVTAAQINRWCVMLADTTLSGTAATIDLTSIPAHWSHLKLVFCGRGDTGTAPAVVLRFNADTGTNYDSQLLAGQAAAASATEAFGGTTTQIGNIPGVSDVASAAGMCVVDIPGYAGTVFHKTMCSHNTYKTATSSGGVVIAERAGHWRSTAAINQITLLIGAGLFVVGTRVSLYGQGRI